MPSLNEQELSEISGYIRERYGVNLATKRMLVESRLGCYMQSKGFTSYGDYFEFVKNDPSGAEMANLINRITTNHTFFMRESDHLEFFINEVLPWTQTLSDSKDVRIWCAGCATGEEPYGLTIHIFESLAARGLSPRAIDTTILASDISEKALAIASEGVYPHDNLMAIPPAWIEKHFTNLGDGNFRVTPQMRSNVAFKKINLLDPFEVRKPYHTIFCRNVMIYFDSETRISVVKRFYDVLAPGGYLFIGHSESLTSFPNDFKYIRPSVYRKPFD